MVILTVVKHTLEDEQEKEFIIFSFFYYKSEALRGLHEVILPSLIPILVARFHHVLLSKELIVGMILLPLLLGPLLLETILLLLPRQHRRLVLLAQFLEVVLLLLPQVRVLLNLGLVKTVDDGVFALRNQNALDLLLVLKADLAHGHAAVLLEVGPWRVDDCDVVLLVTF